MNEPTVLEDIEGVTMGAGVQMGARVTFAGTGIVIGDNVTLEPACVIASGIVVGRGALVRAGAVVLQSVPANAVVAGNPAQVIGYVGGSPQARGDAKHIDPRQFDQGVRPARVGLGVGDSSILLMPRLTDARGSLTVGEVCKDLPFAPARYFAVFDVPSAELRGEHAHRKCEQFLLCLHGSCRLLLDDGTDRCEITLDQPDVGVYMPPMIWGTQYRYSADAVLLAFASEAYDPDDYIRDYSVFLNEAARQKS